MEELSLERASAFTTNLRIYVNGATAFIKACSWWPNAEIAEVAQELLARSLRRQHRKAEAAGHSSSPLLSLFAMVSTSIVVETRRVRVTRSA